MISIILPLPIGNALRVFLDIPAGATRWRLLRRVADTFTGWDDAGALLVLDTRAELSALDTTALKNGTLYFYRLYSLVGAAWLASASMTATPAALLTDACADVLELVRDRLDLGLLVEVAAGRLSHENNHIQVLTAPPVFEETRWPVVTVHLQSESSNVRAIGEDFGSLDDDEEGWLSSVQLTLMGWSLNPDGRIALRKALRRILIGNLAVFDDAGMLQVEISFSDTEDFSSYGAPVYQVNCTLSCIAPAFLRSPPAPGLNSIIFNPMP